jgi:hypothetical protein
MSKHVSKYNEPQAAPAADLMILVVRIRVVFHELVACQEELGHVLGHDFTGCPGTSVDKLKRKIPLCKRD